ncbi:tRNA (adenosine(37)-N6)-dimethylallyltransferase MiaA [methane-oxidizing endosymbiont of Gigantopelta aegis]|uniref:tRNA (adenosine(37)-N6)-dimethylallyltransferase MiaA n=1 Tax=methane-oxidizing endosymbiont of Gigantopelta aegis TaxID=2794938 RepID=UPI0018DBA4CC|nr:tRNA (adenosine(37)-N6)-dimethylallyltransferase MiaA [methane-oxidizing endosymbiont of Gigantopelta aegis]
MMAEKQPPAVFIMGPTASGKTALSIKLAQQWNGEIISVDSAMVYRGMDIGTAKPTLAERCGIPHHLIDILDPAETFSTGQFKALALQKMAEITAQGKIPILVGGTMLYFNVLLNGLAELPEADSVIRQRLDQLLAEQGVHALHQRLAEIDPEAAARIHPNDPQRIQRALEVYEISGRPISDFFKQQMSAIPYTIWNVKLVPPDRKILHDRIARRFDSMLKEGLVEEVRRLFVRGDLNVSLPAIRAVGYRQVWSYLQGDMDYDVMREKGIIATRQLAKRQFTWLRKLDVGKSFDSDDDFLVQKVGHYIDLS